MNSIQQISESVYRYGVQHFSYDRLESPESHVLKDLADSNISADMIRDCTVLLDFRSEGQCNRIVSNLVNTIKQFGATPVVLFNAIVDQSQNVAYEYHCMPAWITKHLDWFETFRVYQNDLTVSRKFLCLMRRPSDSRAKLASQLVQNIHSIKISFGSMYNAHTKPWQSFFPDHQLPLIIDDHVDETKLHVQAQSLFADCLFNIVAESSSQHDPWTWRSKFITEKTFKSFALRQIPIWWAVPGLVAEIRKLGFDVFDDIVDHSYDNEYNENSRLSRVFDHVIALDQTYTVDQCQQLRNQISSRLDYNFNLVQQYCDKQSATYNNIVEQLITKL